MADPASTDKLVCLGVIIGARGIQGAVRIKPFTETPDGIAAYGEVQTKTGERYALKEVKVGQKGVSARLGGIADRDAAEALRGTELYVTRQQLRETEEEEFYYVDLIGLTVRLENGETYGRVKAVQDYGAGPLIEVAPTTTSGKGAKSQLFSFTREVVPEVSLSEGYLVLVPPEEETAEEEANS